MELSERREAELHVVAAEGAAWLVRLDEVRGRDGEGVLDFEEDATRVEREGEAEMVPPFREAIEETCFLARPAIM